jgi:ribosomal protein S27AE
MITPEEAQIQLSRLRELVQGYLVKDIDYGPMPGTAKDCLFKSGAEKLQDIYGLCADYKIVSSVELWDREPSLFDYTIECSISLRDGSGKLTTGLGSCNSYESKYRWRKGKRMCPNCGNETIKASKKEYGAGYYCDSKSGGCGAAWKRQRGDRGLAPDENEVAMVLEIDSQDTSKRPNDDIASCKNTVLKMAKKRALVDAVISATRSSGIFTQDVDDFVEAASVKVTVTPTLASTEWKPTLADWHDLRSKAEARGCDMLEYETFCQASKGRGLGAAGIFNRVRETFLGSIDDDDRNNERDIDIDSDSLDRAFANALHSDS